MLYRDGCPLMACFDASLSEPDSRMCRNSLHALDEARMFAKKNLENQENKFSGINLAYLLISKIHQTDQGVVI